MEQLSEGEQAGVGVWARGCPEAILLVVPGIRPTLGSESGPRHVVGQGSSRIL